MALVAHDGVVPPLLLVLTVLIAFTGGPLGVMAVSNNTQSMIDSFNSTNSTCPNFTTGQDCNNSYYCYWNWNASTCHYKQPLQGGQAASGSVFVPVSWCYGTFAEGFIVFVYFLACLAAGMSIGILFYNYLYHDVYSAVIDGERRFNQFYYKTMPMNIYFALLLASCIFLLVSALVYLTNSTACSYVPAIAIFLVLFFLVPLVLLIIYLVKMFLAWLFRTEQRLNLEEYIRPTTEKALPRLRNQVRCF